MDKLLPPTPDTVTSIAFEKPDSCLGKPFVHFLLVGEQLLDARALYPSGVIVGRPVSSTL